MKKLMQQDCSEFIIKLVDMMDNYPDIVNWNEEKTELVVKDQQKMVQKILVKYFRHNKFESFVRQLNMYNFHKICREKNDSINFKNQLFYQGNEHNFKNIKRKKRCDSKVAQIVEPTSHENNTMGLLFEYKNIAQRKFRLLTQSIISISKEIKGPQQKKIEKFTEELLKSKSQMEKLASQIESSINQKQNGNQATVSDTASDKHEKKKQVYPKSDKLISNAATIIPSTKFKSSFKLQSCASIKSIIGLYEQGAQQKRFAVDSEDSFSIQL